MSHVRRIRVKIFAPRNKGFARRVFAAAPGRAFTQKGIEEILDSVAEAVEKLYPGHDYSLVQTGPESFNFVWRSENSGKVAA
ncbi:MAG: hypothetical protein ABSE45_14990 [Candidatus Acidiferrales bacterium]|jgi:hypothetical protein